MDPKISALAKLLKPLKELPTIPKFDSEVLTELFSKEVSLVDGYLAVEGKKLVDVDIFTHENLVSNFGITSKDDLVDYFTLYKQLPVIQDSDLSMETRTGIPLAPDVLPMMAAYTRHDWANKPATTANIIINIHNEIPYRLTPWAHPNVAPGTSYEEALKIVGDETYTPKEWNFTINSKNDETTYIIDETYGIPCPRLEHTGVFTLYSASAGIKPGGEVTKNGYRIVCKEGYTAVQDVGCVDPCEEGQLYENGKCTTCSHGLANNYMKCNDECTGSQAPNFAGACIDCKQGPADNGLNCNDECESGMGHDETGKCIECSNGLADDGLHCIESCVGGVTHEDGSCEFCEFGVNADTGKCNTECPGFVRPDGVCEQCPFGVHPNGIECLPECNWGFIDESGICQCPEGSIIDPRTGNCLEPCPDGYYTSDLKCVHCTTGLDPNTGSCVVEEKKSNSTLLLLGGGVIVLALAAYFLTKKKKDSDEYY